MKLITPKVRSNQETIDILEDVLQKAKEGKIIEIAMVYKDDEQYYNHRYTTSTDVISELGAVSRLHYVLQKRMDDLQEEG